MSNEDVGELRLLVAHRDAIRQVERQLAQLRSARDDEIQRLCRDGTSERRAAAAAGVAPSYAHRAAVHGRFARRVPK